jgi:hypothetical protein
MILSESHVSNRSLTTHLERHPDTKPTGRPLDSAVAIPQQGCAESTETHTPILALSAGAQVKVKPACREQNDSLPWVHTAHNFGSSRRAPHPDAAGDAGPDLGT